MCASSTAIIPQATTSCGNSLEVLRKDAAFIATSQVSTNLRTPQSEVTTSLAVDVSSLDGLANRDVSVKLRTYMAYRGGQAVAHHTLHLTPEWGSGFSVNHVCDISNCAISNDIKLGTDLQRTKEPCVRPKLVRYACYVKLHVTLQTETETRARSLFLARLAKQKTGP